MSEETLPEASEPVDDGADRYNVPALERGLRVLCEFSRENRTLSAPELARRFKLPRSTVFRLLSTLESMGFIERAEGGREYGLGLAVLRLGFEYLASLPLNELGLPLLERLSEQTQQPCNLVVRDGRSIVYVARVSPPSPFVSAVNVGTRLPAHATVLGHVLLGDLSLPELRRLYPEERLEAFSSSTPRTAVELFDVVQAQRQRGHVLSQGYFEPNISTIAAPVRDDTGRVVAALGMTMNTGRIQDDQIGTLVSQVRETADELSALLNYAPAASGRNVVPLRGGWST
ncbi:MAG: IclR family transcriptional regulator [Ottowia sp.]|uniref:IclR family transcriptional regulator n=1 Tax=Ottowia sp. TaxID=1898956 RepID=UPI0039E5E0E1